jgi:Tfp pilus assembly protein PilO
MSWATIITIILIAVFCIALSIFFSFKRRLDKKSQDEANPELRQAYQDIRRQIDRGHGASGGFFF